MSDTLPASEHTPEPGAGTAQAVRLRRLLYRASHRGTREMDFLLGRFVGAHLATMDGARLAALEALLEQPDPLIGAWILQPESGVPARFVALVAEIRGFHGLNRRRLPRIKG